MPAFLVAFAAMLSQVAGTLVGRVILALGFEFVTFKGMDTAFDNLQSAILNSLGGLPSDILFLFGSVGGFTAISIIFSSVTVRMMLTGIRNGSFTRMLAK